MWGMGSRTCVLQERKPQLPAATSTKQLCPLITRLDVLGYCHVNYSGPAHKDETNRKVWTKDTIHLTSQLTATLTSTQPASQLMPKQTGMAVHQGLDTAPTRQNLVEPKGCFDNLFTVMEQVEGDLTTSLPKPAAPAELPIYLSAAFAGKLHVLLHQV